MSVWRNVASTFASINRDPFATVVGSELHADSILSSASVEPRRYYTREIIHLYFLFFPLFPVHTFHVCQSFEINRVQSIDQSLARCNMANSCIITRCATIQCATISQNRFIVSQLLDSAKLLIDLCYAILSYLYLLSWINVSIATVTMMIRDILYLVFFKLTWYLKKYINIFEEIFDDSAWKNETINDHLNATELICNIYLTYKLL